MGFVKVISKPVICVALFLVVRPAFSAEEETASACVSCHEGSGEKMAAPVALWKKSIHHQMGNNCEGCHGGDSNDPAGAMSPAKGFVGSPRASEIPDFCGKCHVGVVENYKKSPHYKAHLAGSGPTCVTCHRSHDVRKASFDLINEELCSQCHTYDNGRKMKQAFVSAATALSEMREELHLLDRRGMAVKKLEGKFFTLRNSLYQMTHTLDVPEVENKTRSVLSEAEAMRRETEDLRQRVRRRWRIGAAVGGFLVVLILVLVKFLKTFEE